MNNISTSPSTTLAGNTTTSFRPLPKCVLGFPEYLQLVLYILVMILGVFGNASICYCFGLFYKNARKSVSEVLILYLAVVDFCASIFTPFVFIYWISTCYYQWDFGTFGCKLLPFLGRVFINISVGVICILALDRYRAICSPFKGQFKKKHIHMWVLLAVVLAILCEVYYLAALTYETKPLKSGSKGCLVIPSDKKNYAKVTTSILLARDVFFVLIFTYTSIRIILSLKKRDSFYTSPDSDYSSHSRRETERVIRVIITMQIIFIFLVLPRDMLHIIFSLSWLDGDGIPYSKLVMRLNDALKVIQTSNCCANVFIYAKMHGRFRTTVADLFQHLMLCFSKEPRMTHEEIIVKSASQIALNRNRPYTRNLLKPKPAVVIYKEKHNGSNNNSLSNGDTIISELESPALNRKRLLNN